MSRTQSDGDGSGAKSGRSYSEAGRSNWAADSEGPARWTAQAGGHAADLPGARCAFRAGRVVFEAQGIARASDAWQRLGKEGFAGIYCL